MEQRHLLIEVSQPVDSGRTRLYFIEKQQRVALFDGSVQYHRQLLADLLRTISLFKEGMQILPIVQIYLHIMLEPLAQMAHGRSLAHLARAAQQ